MKLIVFGTLIAALGVSAQVFTAPDPTAIVAPTRSTTSECAVKSILDECIRVQDDYIKNCNKEPSCLCTRNTQKKSCWENCPNDIGLKAQQDTIQIACSVPGANVSITPWSNTLAPTSTNSIASNTFAVSVSTASVTPSKVPSGSSAVAIQDTCLLILVASVYLLF